MKFGAVDYAIVQSAANDDAHVGVSDLGADDQGDRVDVHRAGVVRVEYGGNITRGDPLTSDADGRAITAVAGGGVRYIGFAEVSGVLGDIGLATVDPGFISVSVSA